MLDAEAPVADVRSGRAAADPSGRHREPPGFREAEPEDGFADFGRPGPRCRAAGAD